MKYSIFLLLFLVAQIKAFTQVNQNKSICSGGTINYTSFEFGLPDTTNFTWNYAVSAGNVTGASSASTPTKNLNQTLYTTGNLVGVVVYYITPSYGNPFTLTLNINPTSMTVDASGITPIICSGSNFYAGVTGVPANTQYTWTTPSMSSGVTGGAAQSNSQSYIYSTAFNLHRCCGHFGDCFIYRYALCGGMCKHDFLFIFGDCEPERRNGPCC